MNKEHIPYFYIIREKKTGMKYAGCKFGRDANPESFLTIDGYLTSSPTIRNIILDGGVESFEIITIMTESDCGMDVYSYETKFLTENDCAGSGEWYNAHNNTGHAAYGSEEFRSRMFLLYGVDNVSKSEVIKGRKRFTTNKNYGVDNPMKSDEIKKKTASTNINRYGVEFVMQSPEIREKSRQAVNERYGVDNVSKLPEVKEKICKTNLERYGETSYLKTEAGKLHVKEGYLLSLGVDNPMKSKTVLELREKRSLEKYGVSSPAQRPEHRQNLSEQRKGIYWFYNSSENIFATSKDESPEWLTELWSPSSAPVNRNQKKIICEHCNREFLKSHHTRFHGNKCKMRGSQ